MSLLSDKLAAINIPTYNAIIANNTVNANVLTIGAPCSGKTLSIVLPAVLASAEKEESFICTETNSAVSSSLTPYLYELGYEIRTVNISDPARSDSWNCFDWILSPPQYSILHKAEIVSDVLLRNSMSGTNRNNLPYNTAFNLLRMLIIRAATGTDFGCEDGCVGDKSLASLYELLYSREKLEDLFDWNAHPETRLALPSYCTYKAAPEYIKISAVSMAMDALSVFIEPAVSRITRAHTINLRAPAQKPCAYFINLNETKSRYKVIASLFLTCCMHEIMDYMRESPSVFGHMDPHVSFLLDNLHYCGWIHGLDHMLPVCTARNISVLLTINSIVNLTSLYPEEWQQIANNAETLVGTGFADVESIKYFRNRIVACVEDHELYKFTTAELYKMPLEKLIYVQRYKGAMFAEKDCLSF